MSKLQSVIQKFLTNPGYLDKGAGYLAKTFNTTKDTIYKAKEEARKHLHNVETTQLQNIIADQEQVLERKFDTAKGTCIINGKIARRITNLKDLIGVCEIDTDEWEIDTWECNKWEVGSKGVTKEVQVTPLFQIKAKLKKVSREVNFQKAFKQFLEQYTPNLPVFHPISLVDSRPNSLLVIPKQDAHFDRIDVRGNNDIAARFKQIEDKSAAMLKNVCATNYLTKVVYVIGSDQLNSEWTGATTGGTPQQNLVGYQEGFKLVCDHEPRMLHLILSVADEVEVLFVPGNHDEYASWHIINWLQCYHKDNTRIKFVEGDLNTPRRYQRFSNTAMMFDHGAYNNGKELAAIFPKEFRKEWSLCDNFYIFSGDKHHEQTLDIQGIKFFRVPAMTSTRSKWEQRKYISEGEIQMFVIQENEGMIDRPSRMLK